MQHLHCTLPLPRVPQAALSASNQISFLDIAPTAQARPTRKAHAGNVRLMRRFKDKDHNRFALSGKLADVCAALDALAAQEAQSTWRMAAQ